MSEANPVPRQTTVPGRTGFVAALCVSNARAASRREWGVRVGTLRYPDYAQPHPERWDGTHRGRFLTADEADELADLLQRSAAWARAQQALEGDDG